MNTFGHLYRFTSAGESHGPALTGIVDGMPAGIMIDFDAIDTAMKRRRPGSGPAASARNEKDEVTFLSGIKDGVTLGTPIAFTIPNTDARSADYDRLARTFRPSHADFTYQAKYGIRDHRGGGRASARETALRVVAGELAMQVLAPRGITVHAYASRIGSVALEAAPTPQSLAHIYDSSVGCPDATASAAMEAEIMQAKSQGDTLGGIVSCVIGGVPAGLGEPIFGKLQAMLASAMMSINAAHGFEYGMGFSGAACRGSEMIDEFIVDDAGRIATATNHSGGIQGGISNGMGITMSVAFKPVATMMRPVRSVGAGGREVAIEPRGRHDVCVVPRAIAVVRAMAAMTMLDAWLLAGRR